jgi:hypothetical protein
MCTGQVLECDIFYLDIDGVTLLDKYIFDKNKRWLKVKLKSLYLINRYARLEVQLKAQPLKPLEITFCRFWIGGWMTQRASLDGVENRRIS